MPPPSSVSVWPDVIWPGDPGVAVVTRPVSPGAEEFLSWLAVEKGRSTNTLAAYRRDIAAFEEWARAEGVDPERAEIGVIETHLARLRAEGRHPSSMARSTTTLRGLYRFLATEGVIDRDPTTDLRSPRLPRRLPKALDEDEVLALIDSVAGPEPVDLRDRALLELLYGTGARISEVVGLDLADLARDDGLLRVFGKGAKERMVPLGVPAHVAVERWLSPAGRPCLTEGRKVRRTDAEALFLNTRGGRLTRQGAWAAIQGRAQRVGLGDRVSPHVLRHSCASHMLAHGADIRVVQEILGHVSIATTQMYTKLSQEHLRSSYERAHPRATASQLK
jgi:integrase/recombinase XerD